MRYSIGAFVVIAAVMVCSCAKKQDDNASKAAAEAPASAQPANAPHAFVYLKDGSKIPGTIVASSQSDIVVAGDDGIERKIPQTQIKSVEYGEASKADSGRKSPRESAQSKPPAREIPAPAQQNTGQPMTQQSAQAPGSEPSSPPPPPTRTYELPSGSQISVRTNVAIDSGTATEGQTFDAQVTRDAKDASGAVVIPRGSEARVVIKSASKGGRFRGASDLVLDLQSVSINGRPYEIDTIDISQKGKSGIGANKRTAEYTGGGAALGAIIGAIAGGGKGAAIGAGAGAGAGALTQVVTKGRAIKVPAESVLTFSLDKPLKVVAKE